MCFRRKCTQPKFNGLEANGKTIRALVYVLQMKISFVARFAIDGASDVANVEGALGHVPPRLPTILFLVYSVVNLTANYPSIV